jgi:hypothetical protein
VLGFTLSYSPCGTTNTATTDFTLTSDPGSTLVLDESANLCGLGHDGAAFRGYFANGAKALGHPFAIVGTSWTVDNASTGVFKQFIGLAASGTDLHEVVNVAGMHAIGSYGGTLS